MRHVTAPYLAEYAVVAPVRKHPLLFEGETCIRREGVGKCRGFANAPIAGIGSLVADLLTLILCDRTTIASPPWRSRYNSS